jgi:hypothetical protein
MKNMKRLIVSVVVAIGVLGLGGVAYAADIKTPADIAAALTGKSVEDVTKERSEGKTYGTIAKEAGKLDEFKAQMLEQKKAVLDQRVKDGILTQQQADEIYNQIKTNQAACDGTGNAGIGKKYGAGFGQGKGMGRGMGRGAGMGNASCGGAGCGMGVNR